MMRRDTDTDTYIDSKTECPCDEHDTPLLGWLLLSLLAAAAFMSSIAPVSADAQRTIYRCVAAKAAVSYQDVPCASNQTMTALHRFKSTELNPALLARSRAIEQEMERRNHGRTSAARSTVSRAQKPKAPSRCEAAKAKRETSLDKLGFKRDFELMSALDRAVWDACQGL
jgi:hypothetical protein